jgi:hypothetical protein
VLTTAGARFPSNPVLLKGEIAWCALVDAGVLVFRYAKESDSMMYELSAETSCPNLLVLNGRLFGFSGRDGGTLLDLAPDRPILVKAGITADQSAGSWSASAVAGKLALLTQLGGTRLLLIDEQGSLVWTQNVAFPILTPAASDAHSVFVAGDRAIARFPLPSEAQP